MVLVRFLPVVAFAFAVLLTAGCSRSRAALDVHTLTLESPEKVAATYLVHRGETTRQFTGADPRIVKVERESSIVTRSPLLPHRSREWREVAYLVEGEGGSVLFTVELERRGRGAWRLKSFRWKADKLAEE